MKTKIVYIAFVFMIITLFSSCTNNSSKAPNYDVSEEKTESYQETKSSTTSNDDEIICEAIAAFLKGDKDACRFAPGLKNDLSETTWPEVYCQIEGDLESPASFKDLVVKVVGPGKYKYECVCPVHDMKFVDYTTISASLSSDGTVIIEDVQWDPDDEQPHEPPLAEMLEKCNWNKTKYGFKVPEFMVERQEEFFDEIPANVAKWDFFDICFSCLPSLGTWAVIEYPGEGMYLTGDIRIKDITYTNSSGSIYSGHTDDGRIWYMKKNLLEGGEVIHANVLALIYPESRQEIIDPLMKIVKNWE